MADVLFNNLLAITGVYLKVWDSNYTQWEAASGTSYWESNPRRLGRGESLTAGDSTIQSHVQSRVHNPCTNWATPTGGGGGDVERTATGGGQWICRMSSGTVVCLSTSSYYPTPSILLGFTPPRSPHTVASVIAATSAAYDRAGCR